MTGFLTTNELKYARFELLRISQEIDFSDEIKELKLKGQIYTNSKLSKLCPFIDSFKVLRVGGRIQNSDLNYGSKHPILLKRQNPLSYLIFLMPILKLYMAA